MAAAAMLVGLALSIGCTKVKTSTGTGPHGAHSWTQAGVLRLADISDPSTLNPMLTGADVGYQLASFTLEYLVQLDDRGSVIPVLCTEVPSRENGLVSKDGLSVTYHLREGVTWSDGEPFSSADVVASWKQVMNPLNNVQIREGYDAVERIDTPDKHTAVVHLKSPYAAFPTRFFAAIQEGPIAVMPAHIIGSLKELNDAAFSSKPVGTGPFVVQSWERNGRLIFVANPRYWRGPPKLKKIIFQAQPSDATELVGFQTHELDADLDAGSQRAPEYRKLSDMHPRQSRSLRLSVAVMNAGREPLKDVRLRRAIAYSLDRQTMLHNIQHDVGYVADEFLPKWSWAYTPDVPHYDYNPHKAAALLDEAGWRLESDGYRHKNGKVLNVIIVGATGSGAFKQTAELAQSYVRAVGIEATIKTYPYGIVFNISGPIRGGNYDLAFYSYSVNYDPASLNDDGCDQFAPKGANEARLCDPIVDKEEREGLRISDVEQRKKIYADIQRRRMEDVGYVPLYFRDRMGVVTDDLHNYTASNGIIPEWNAWQWSLP